MYRVLPASTACFLLGSYPFLLVSVTTFIHHIITHWSQNKDWIKQCVVSEIRFLKLNTCEAWWQRDDSTTKQRALVAISPNRNRLHYLYLLEPRTIQNQQKRHTATLFVPTINYFRVFQERIKTRKISHCTEGSLSVPFLKQGSIDFLGYLAVVFLLVSVSFVWSKF